MNLAIAVGDISKVETAQKLVEIAKKRFGGVDILINNAGIFKPTPFLEHRFSYKQLELIVLLDGLLTPYYLVPVHFFF